MANLTDDMKSRRKKNLVLVGVVLGCCVLAYLFLNYPTSQVKEAYEPKPAKAAEQIYDPPPVEKPKMPTLRGDLQANPDSLAMGTITIGKGTYSGSFTLTARRRPIRIRTVNVSFAQQSGIKIDAQGCIDRQLNDTESCTVDVLFDPLNPTRIDKQIVVTAESDDSDGSKHQVDRQVALSGEAVLPPPPPTAARAEPVRTVAIDEGRPNPALVAYLTNRQQLGGLNSMDVVVGPQKPSNDDWQEINQQRSMSTYPSDLSHVLTIDKSIPAVIKVGIDTRYANRAIAVVERDIYGGDGRIVVVPRGSTVTGTISASGSSGEEKVQMQFTRLVRPDGAAFAIQAFAGDAMGRPGVPAYIDRRYAERFGMSALTTAANIGATIGLNGQQTAATSGSGVVATQDANSVATQQLNAYAQTVTAQLDKEGQQISPIRSVPPGTRVTIYPTADLFLKPIVPTEQMRQAILAKRRAQSELEANYRKDAFREDAVLSGEVGPNGQPITNAVPGVTQQSASQTQISYDPITGQPVVRSGTATATTTRPGLDRTGFPYLPGNTGLQTPADVGGAPLLNGTDASGSQMIRERQAASANLAAQAGVPPIGSTYGGGYPTGYGNYGAVPARSVNAINGALTPAAPLPW
jgi:type IV secretion system protein VirB10